LRYINAFSPSNLGVSTETPWTDFINPFALGFLSNDKISAYVKGHIATSEIDLDNNAIARIVTSTGFVGNVMFQQNPELSFIVDSDLFFNSKKDLDNIDDSLNYLNDYANRIIRSIITENLHKLMEPEVI